MLPTALTMLVQSTTDAAAHAAHGAASDAAAAPAPAGDGFLPHGYCYQWNESLLVTHVTSDVLIGLSYVVISLALVSLVHRARRDIPFSLIFVAFGLFIVACGMTHFMEIWTLWQPVYWLSGGVKAVTAVASVTTAAVMPAVVPRVLTTVRTAALARERELAAARADALEAQNELLQAQAAELEHQTEEAQALAEELEQTNRDLVRALADAEHARRDAEDARHTAEAANRAKDEFLAVMSHELRTPLNAIGGYAALMAEGVSGPVTERQHEDLARIQRSQRHLLALINEVLNFTRLETGQVQYATEAVAVEPLFREVESLVAPQRAARRLRPAPTPHPPRLAVLADGDKLRQVLLNLLSNAVKFTPAGGTVELESEVDADGGRVHLRVRDTGVGIPADKLEAIFEPFVQLDQSLTRSAGGIGLGLAISRDLARGMGGDLTVRSAVGVGSTFTVTLPRA